MEFDNCTNCCNNPILDFEYWNTLDEDVLNYTNCYSYAFDRIENNRNSKLQPGELSNDEYNKYTCNHIVNKIKKDHSGIYKTDNIEYIPCNHYKIALVIDNKGNHDDYHFYRKDHNGLWSHKRGKYPITNLDASNNLIYDPKYADRNYDKEDNDEFNYEIFCGYYSIPYTGKKTDNL